MNSLSWAAGNSFLRPGLGETRSWWLARVLVCKCWENSSSGTIDAVPSKSIVRAVMLFKDQYDEKNLSRRTELSLQK